MISQNKLNAGAEYLLYRIWATLQSSQGIHVESLLTCVGGLAGYACRRYAKQTGHLDALIDSPLSIWSLVSRAVLKLGEPLPDIREIVRKVDAEDGAPRLPDWHRPDHPTVVYLKQLWPQTLPIAQRFCARPIHMPVLYGIALQRAIEHTKDRLSPTLAASISMECAIAMSRVELPEPVVEQSAVTGISPPIALPSMRATQPARSRPAPEPRRGLHTINRVPPAVNVTALACLAFVATAAAMYGGDGNGVDVEAGEPVFEALGERYESGFAVATSAGSTSAERNAATPTESVRDSAASASAARNSAVPMLVASTPAAAAAGAVSARSAVAAASALSARSAVAAASAAEPVLEAAPLANPDEDLPRPQPANFGADEGLMRDDAGQTIRMAAEMDDY